MFSELNQIPAFLDLKTDSKKQVKAKMKMYKSATGLFVLILLSYFVFATPNGPGQITTNTPDRRGIGIDNATGGDLFPADAGNLTSMNVTSTKISLRWQGYYGNVTGSITLDDANNKSLYNWNIANPLGEIYASNGSAIGAVTWSNIFCFNYSNNLSAGQNMVQRFNGSTLESMIGASNGDRDNVNSTFNSTFTGSFSVGSTAISSTSGCRQVTLNVNDGTQKTQFVEVLLSDNNSIVYTSILEQDATGFQGSPVDFEMIVGENGDIPAATSYYFFVELS